MSFMITEEQIRNRTKRVTRRLGWADLKPGELFNMVKQCQGLKKGEKIVYLDLGRCVSNRPEPLNAITKEECILEGFPDLEPEGFVEMFSKHNRCPVDKVINRIEFDYVD
ncbi:MAG TPA: ASCH domain-containing protein [Blastocatellia bacterium]